MATTIDVLILALDLDPKNFDKGRKEAAEAFLKLREQSRRFSEESQEPLNKFGETLSTVTRRLGTFAAAFLGGKAIAATTQFGAEIAKVNVELGNLSRTTGINVEVLSKWQGMAERAGSSAQGISGAILSIDRELKNFAVGKGAPALMAVVSSLNKSGAGIELVDELKNAKPATDILMDIADALERLKVPRDNAVGLLRTLGIDEPTIALLLRGSTGLRKLLKEQDEIFKVTQKDIEAADRLNDAWHRLTQTTKSFGQVLLTEIEPVLTRIMNAGSGAVTGARDKTGVTPGQGNQGGQGAVPSGGGARASNTHSIPPGAPPPAGMGLTQAQWDAYRQGVANIESSGGNYGLIGGAGNKYLGAYQMGPAAISEAARSLGEPVPSARRFLADANMQERYFAAFTAINNKRLMQNPRYREMTPEQRLQTLGYAHNQGSTGARRHLETGRVGRDAFGTPGTAFSDSVRRQLEQTSEKRDQNIPWLANPRLLRAPRFNTTVNTTNDYSTAETTVHSLIFNGPNKPATDDAYGLSVDAVPALARGREVIQSTDGPN